MGNFFHILEFLNKYSGQDYSSLDGTIATYGKLAYNTAKFLGYKIAEKFDNFEFVGSSKWQNSGHVAKYFWLQFKRNKNIDKPFSISIGTIKVDNKYRFKVYLEVADSDAKIFDKSNIDNLRDFNQAILKLEQPNVCFYYEGMTPYKKYEKIPTDAQSVIQALSNGKYLKITTNIDVVIEETDSDDFILDKLCRAFEVLIPHYDIIFGDVQQTNNWILPCNIEMYDVIGAFDEYDSLDWHITPQTKNIKKGDLVYIYVGKPYSRLMFECVVEKTAIGVPEIDDKTFYKEGNWNSSSGYFRIKLLRKLFSLHLSLDDLNHNGVTGNIQGPRKIDKKVKDYISPVTTNDAVLVPIVVRIVLANMTELEIEAVLNAEDESSCYVYKESLVKTRKINKEIVYKLKVYYKGQCQLCGECVGQEFGKEIVEAHHIEYFSKTQNNDSSNIIILCPNCHALIHKCNPVYNKKDYSFDFNDYKRMKIKVVGHLKNG